MARWMDMTPEEQKHALDNAEDGTVRFVIRILKNLVADENGGKLDYIDEVIFGLLAVKHGAVEPVRVCGDTEAEARERMFASVAARLLIRYAAIHGSSMDMELNDEVIEGQNIGDWRLDIKKLESTSKSLQQTKPLFRIVR